MSKPFVKLTGYVSKDAAIEDSGCAKIADVCGDDSFDGGMFVKLQSWSEEQDHSVLDKFLGHKVRVTVEVID
jgi:hypothetical protein